MTRKEILNLLYESQLCTNKLHRELIFYKMKLNEDVCEPSNTKLIDVLCPRILNLLKRYHDIEYDSLVSVLSNVSLRNLKRTKGIGKTHLSSIIKACQKSNIKLLT